MRLSKLPWTLFAVCFLLFSLGASAQTPDNDRYWTTAGSTGTLDEASEGKVFFDHAVVQKGTMPVVGQGRQLRSDGSVNEETDSAFIRYNVTAVDGLFGANDLSMTVRFRAEGKSARVVAKLVEIDVATGDEVTRLTFDSDTAPTEAGYHVWDAHDCEGRTEPFDFVKKAYYIDATLTTSAFVAESAAGIEIIQLFATTCSK